jgi:hypothetical protein
LPRRKQADGFGDKQPPSNHSAEECVIASLLINADEYMPEVIQFLKPQHFQREVNGWCYEAMVYLFDREQDIDEITVTRRLEEMNKLVDVGGAGYLPLLLSRLPTSIHCLHWAHIVHNCAILRKLIYVAGNIAAIGYEGGVNTIEESVQRAQDTFDQVWEEMGKTPFVISDFVMTESDPPQYDMRVNGLPVKMAIEDLLDFKRFKKFVAITCRFVPMKQKDEEWNARLNRLFRLMKLEKAPREASVEYATWQAALEVLRSHPLVDTVEDFEAGLPTQRGTHIYFKGAPFMASWGHKLKQTGGFVPDVSVLWGILKKHDGKPGKVRFGTERKDGWQLSVAVLNGTEPEEEQTYQPEDIFV